MGPARMLELPVLQLLKQFAGKDPSFMLLADCMSDLASTPLLQFQKEVFAARTNLGRL